MSELKKQNIMGTTLKIKVTKEILDETKHCDSSLPSTGKSCAIAVAVREIFPKAYVENDFIFPFNKQGESTKILLPKNAQVFIERFDESTAEERINMNPIEFEVAIPDNVIKKINIEELRPLLVNHPTLEIVQ